MALVNTLYNTLGLHGRPQENLNFIYGGIGTQLRGFSKLISIYEAFDDPDKNDITFTSLTGSLVNAISLGTERTILRRLVIKEDQQGSKDFILELNELPELPLVKGTIVEFKVNLQTLFTGYIWRSPEPGTNERGYFTYSGFGMRKRTEKQIIVEDTLYLITTVSQSGSNTTFNTAATIPGSVVTGQRLLVSGCDNRSNNVNAIITGVTSNSVTVANNGANESPTNATFKILPLEWSDGSILVSEIFKQIITTYDNGTSGIKYAESRIADSTGVILGGQTGADFNGMTIWKFMDTIRTSLLANGFEIGIDNEGFYFLRVIDETVTDVKFIGFDANEFDIQTDIDGVINSVTVGRKKGKSEGGAGFAVAASDEDLTSIALYLRNHKKIEIPGYLSDEFAEDYAESYIANNKDPKVTAKISRLDFTGKIQFAQNGIAIPAYNTNRILSLMDDFDDFTTSPEITRSLDTFIKVFGSASHKLEFDLYTGSLSHRLDYTNAILSFAPTKFSYWIRSNKPGSVIKFLIGIGEEELEFETVIAENGVFQEVEIEIDRTTDEGSEINGEIEYIEWVFDNSEDGTIIYIDYAQMVDFYSQRYVLPIEEVEYSLAPEGDTVAITYGEKYEEFDDMIAGIISQMENFKLLLREP
jgi:hypothetical protein